MIKEKAVNEAELISKAGVLLEALPYIQRFHDSVFVVKYGGSFMDSDDPATRERVASDIVFLNSVGIKVVVVHGGGKAITRAMAKSDVVPQWRNGMRVTDERTIKIVEDTLNNEINTDICRLIEKHKGVPVGMPGNLVNVCEKLCPKDETGEIVDLGLDGALERLFAEADEHEDLSVLIVGVAAEGEDLFRLGGGHERHVALCEQLLAVAQRDQLGDERQPILSALGQRLRPVDGEARIERGAGEQAVAAAVADLVAVV